MSQIELHKDGIHVANYPLQDTGTNRWVNVFSSPIPWTVKQEIIKFINGESYCTRMNGYSWNWKRQN